MDLCLRAGKRRRAFDDHRRWRSLERALSVHVALRLWPYGDAGRLHVFAGATIWRVHDASIISDNSSIEKMSSCLFAAVLASDEARDHGGQFGRLNRLGDVHLEAGVQGAHPVFDPPISRERHRGDVSAPSALPLTHSPYHGVAVFTWHSYVGHHYIEPPL